VTGGEREPRQALADHRRELEAMTGEARSEVNVRVRRMAIDDEVLFRSHRVHARLAADSAWLDAFEPPLHEGLGLARVLVGQQTRYVPG